jgi:PPK2 family polyphosphate:nucleotide phosphotransferase
MNPGMSTSAPEGYTKAGSRQLTGKLIPELNQALKKLLKKKERSVLIVLQGMDASGKDGCIKNVFSRLDSAIGSVTAFSVPDATELEHDFLWRVHPYAPGKGRFQVFNRSYYEDLLIPEVHETMDPEFIKRRYGYVNAFENLLMDHGTLIFKFFLNISRREQSERFRERLENPEKRWKYDIRDIEEARMWDKYMAVYRRIFRKCSLAPWIIVPADQKWYRDFFIVSTLTERLKEIR